MIKIVPKREKLSEIVSLKIHSAVENGHRKNRYATMLMHITEQRDFTVEMTMWTDHPYIVTSTKPELPTVMASRETKMLEYTVHGLVFVKTKLTH